MLARAGIYRGTEILISTQLGVDLLCIPEQLNVIQNIIDAVSDHIEDSLNTIHSLEHEDTHTGTYQPVQSLNKFSSKAED